MKLRYYQNLVAQHEGAAKIAALAWSPNNVKLAVCAADRVITLYDDNFEKRDKFSTKPIDAKVLQLHSYIIQQYALCVKV